VAIDAVSHTAIAVADCAAKGFQLANGVLNVPAMAIVALLDPAAGGRDP